MKTVLLSQFAEFLEKQDTLSKLTEHEKLHDHGYSEVHVIAAIGDLDHPNVTRIAQTLKLTKGAVSKIAKRLAAASLIETYTLPGNRQKIYFRLTPQGQLLYAEHSKRHERWLCRDERFLARFSQHQLRQISDFMASYNSYLEEQIQELEEDRHAD